jgi:hypothetical protein
MTKEEGALTEAERTSLRLIAGMMIPATKDLPGADDDAIFADIVSSLGRDSAMVRDALSRLDALSGGRFADIGGANAREAAVAALRAEGGSRLEALHRVIPQCYHRDDRVMRAFGMEPRPPFPRGFEVEQGDWSLLDPVRARQKFYRPVR